MAPSCFLLLPSSRAPRQASLIRDEQHPDVFVLFIPLNAFLSLRSNNILYPRENRERKTLLYACRNCDRTVRSRESAFRCRSKRGLGSALKSPLPCLTGPCSLSLILITPPFAPSPRARRSLRTTIACTATRSARVQQTRSKRFRARAARVAYSRPEPPSPLSPCQPLAYSLFLLGLMIRELTQVIMDISADPTLPRTRDVRCAKCGNTEAVFFQARPLWYFAHFPLVLR